jgi:hypothetical protein
VTRPRVAAGSPPSGAGYPLIVGALDVGQALVLGQGRANGRAGLVDAVTDGGEVFLRVGWALMAVGLVKPVRLRCLRILVDQAAQDRSAVNPGGVQVNDVRRRIRWLLSERAMWTVAVVVAGVLVDDRRQVPLADDEHPVRALSAYRAHPALGRRTQL